MGLTCSREVCLLFPGPHPYKPIFPPCLPRATTWNQCHRAPTSYTEFIAQGENFDEVFASFPLRRGTGSGCKWLQPVSHPPRLQAHPEAAVTTK
ncbi:hypothetical protein I79_002393 [Cricetulus griseus]|uniref:Uncharacterized protein n=1 Tax=Cricetulus griseus TaxID=10029 RepID=G3GX78_CRIGR|nr:hypothetical protein I79_002393 [Cricetulus griseus]